mgnify:CR=1 FL=1
MVLETAPDFEMTHWKQTIVGFEQFFEIPAGEEIEFSLDFAQSEDNKRQYDISFVS